MTHQQVLEILRRAQKRPNAVSPGEVGDYISIAMANDWTRGRIVAELTLHYLKTTGTDHLDRITHLVDTYINGYGTEITETPVPVKINGAKAVKIDGKEYESITAAGRSLGVSREKINRMITRGEAICV